MDLVWLPYIRAVGAGGVNRFRLTRSGEVDFRTKVTYVAFLIICTKGTAMIEVTVSEARERLADLLGKVQHGGEDVTIKKHGKPVAVMISPEAMEYYERLENEELAREGAAAYAEYLADPSQAISHEQLWAEIEADLKPE
jgi:prevent-host-death family protein